MLRAHMIQRIAREGPIPFDAFMQDALYHPRGGFFTGPTLRSEKAGDFLTSPEVSDLFGSTLAEFVREERVRVGEPFRLVDVAAGSGSLLRPLLEVEAVEAWAVEVSPAARRTLSPLLGADRVVDSLAGLPAPIRGVVLANELVDNLPMAIAQRLDGRWRERWVGSEGDRLVFVDAAPRREVLEWLDRFAGRVEEGGWVEVQLQATQWVIRALGILQAGALVVFDYGDSADNLAPRRRDGTLRTYRAHHLGPHPLAEPGATDVTADVNFTALEWAARSGGAKVETWRQEDFLAAHGLRERMAALRHRELELAREGGEMERLRVRTLRQEAETLMHPRGLGDFRVMVARPDGGTRPGPLDVIGT